MINNGLAVMGAKHLKIRIQPTNNTTPEWKTMTVTSKKRT